MFIISKYGNCVTEVHKADYKEFWNGKSSVHMICVNDMNFGDYEEMQGRIVFKKILAALKSGERFFDMREVEFGDV